MGRWALWLGVQAVVFGQLLPTVTPPQWSYVFADPTIILTPRSNFVATTNSSHLVIAGGETSSTSTATLQAITYRLPASGTGLGTLNAESGTFGTAYRATRAAYATYAQPVTTSGSNAPVGAGSYAVAFGGLSSTGAELDQLYRFETNNATWSTVTTATKPAARQGAAMAYLHNCNNGTSCFVMTGGSSRTSGLLSDTAVYWPNVGALTSSVQCAVVPERVTANIFCPSNTYITQILFASYGTPTGSCPNFQYSTCHNPTTATIVSGLCLGKNTCSFFADNTVYTDPCTTIAKSLAVAVLCAPNTGWVALTGTGPTARSGHSLVSSHDGRFAFLFGGQTSTGVSNDVYALAAGSGFDDPLASELTNIALRAQASGSTVLSGARAINAVSGTINTAFSTTNCYQGNTGQTAPWWMTDLGGIRQIDSITIWRRTDVGVGTLAGFQVYVGMSSTSYAGAVQCPNPYTDVAGSSVNIKCTSLGRYVWVVLPGTNRQLTLCQVQVWQANPFTWRKLSGIAEVAFGAKVTQSSTYQTAPGGDPARAVDGLINGGNYGTQPFTCTHTLPGGVTNQDTWMLVDLGSSRDVVYMDIFPRKDCCTTRNQRWQVWVGNSLDWKNNFRCTVPADVTPAGTTLSTRITCAATGRYVHIVRPWVTGDENILTVCELKVYAQLLSNMPSARTGHAAAMFRGNMVIFGGTDANGIRLNDVLFFSTVTRTWDVATGVIGTPPAARAFAALLPISPFQLAMFGGMSSIDPLNDEYVMEFPACPAIPTGNLGIAGMACYHGGTTCYYTCSPGFTDANNGLPLLCGLDGLWVGNSPPCVGTAPSIPLSVTAIAEPGVSNTARVMWSQPSSLTPFASVVNYKITAVTQYYSFANFKPAVKPAEWASNWNFQDPTNGQHFYAFADGALTVEAAGSSNCWGTTNLCPIAYRNSWPPNVPQDSFWYEGYVYLDTTTTVTQGATFAGIGIFDTRYNIIQFYAGAMNTGTYSVIWENIDNAWGWSQGNGFTIPGGTTLAAYIRIEYNKVRGQWTAYYRYNINDEWSRFPSIGLDSQLRGGAIPAANMRIAFLVKNWSTGYANGFVTFMNAGAMACNAPGPTRTVPGTTTVATVGGLTAGSSYTFMVSAATLAGYGPSARSSSMVPTAPGAAGNPPTILVSLNKPASMSNAWCNTWGCSAASMGVDGAISTSQITSGQLTNLVDTSGGPAPARWQVDLLKSTDVITMRLYGRSDSQQSRNTGLLIFVGDSSRYLDNTRCPGLSTSILSAPWYQDLPCRLTGRYVTIVNPQSPSVVNFAELQVYAANSCPTRNGTNAQTVPGSKCVGAVYGDVCQLQCRNGFVQVSGGTTANCRGASWDQGDLVCAPSCPDTIPPDNFGSCTQSLFSEDFSNATTALTRFLSLNPITQPMGTSWVVVDNQLQAAAIQYCSDELYVLAQSTPVANWPSAFTYSANIQTSNIAGLLIKATNLMNFYRVVIDTRGSKVSLQRMASGVLTTLIDASMTLDSALTHVVSVSYSNGQINCTVNNKQVFNTRDVTLVTGSAGMYAATTASFSSVVFAVPCFACSGATNGAVCQYQCAPGMVQSNNGTLICRNNVAGTGAYWAGAVPACTVPPPVFFSTTRSTPEFAPTGAKVGSPLVATSTDPTSQVLFKISGGNVWNTFRVDSCSGQLVVRNASLDITVISQYNLTVTAYIAGSETTSFTIANVTVLLTPVYLPPVIATQTMFVPEASPPGYVLGVLNYTIHLPLQMNWTWQIDSAGGAFTIDPLTRIVRVSNIPNVRSMINYHSVPNVFAQLVAGTPNIDATLKGTGTLNIFVTEINNPPVLQPALQIITVPEMVAVDNATVGFIGAFKANQPPSPFASAINFTQISGASEATSCPINATLYPNMKYATADGTVMGATPIVLVNSTTGEITLRNTALITGAASASGSIWRNMNYFSYANAFVRALYSVCIRLSDGLGGFTVGAIQFAVVANIPAQPVISSIGGNTTMTTLGSDVVQFSGQNFGAPGARVLRASYANGARTYNASSCWVDPISNGTVINCRSVPGAGTGYIWSVFLDSVVVQSSISLITNYEPPVVTSLVGGTQIPTATNNLLIFSGTGFGPAGTPVTIVYGNSFTFPCTFMPNATDSHNVIRCMTVANTASGQGLPWSITVDGQQVTSASLSGSTISFAAPTISNITVTGDNILSLDTSGGSTVLIDGRNFGEPTANILATYGGSAGTLLTFASCRQLNPTRISCLTVPGSGMNLPVTLRISTVAMDNATSGVAALGQGLTYRRPTLTAVTGPGAKGGSTAGGQEILLLGTGFGPITYPIAIASAVYGHPGNLNFQATSCRVVQEPPQQGMLSCITAPGVGARLAWQVTINGQTSNLLLDGSSYAAPIVSAFSGVGASDALTVGGQIVKIAGSNFGPMSTPNSLLYVYYGTLIYSGPVSSLYFNATSCSITQDHVEITCQTIPFAGAYHNWKVVVDGQVSSNPTTSYAKPSIDAIVDTNGNATVIAADVNGGMNVTVWGSNFSPPSLINGSLSLLQTVQYGLSGSEYNVPLSNVFHVSHSQIIVTLLPGSGSGLKFRMQVADQWSDASTSTFAYAEPQIMALAPPVAPTGMGTVVTVVAKNLPLRDPRSRIIIQFGVPGISSRLITPQLPVGLAAELRATNPDGSVNITFPVPTDMAGAQLPVQIVVLPSSQEGSSSIASAVAVSNVTAASLFSFVNPYIANMVVVRARFRSANSTAGDGLSVPCPFAASDPVWSCSDPRVLMLVVSGSSFGPDPATMTASDGVTRSLSKLMFHDTQTQTVVWSNSPSVLYPISFSHTRIVALTFDSSAVIRILLQGTGFYGPTTQQVSQLYSSLSPAINALAGGSGPYPTTGGSVVNITVENLAGATGISVSIGGVPCRLLDTNRNDVTSNSISILTASTSLWNFFIVIPPGQGTGNPVLVTRYDGAATQVSDPGFTIDYMPPVILRVESFGGTSQQPSTWASFSIDPVLGGTVTVPTYGTILKIYGNNLGVSPRLIVADAAPAAGVACNGEPAQSCYQFSAPQGEGSGLQSSNLGVFAPYGYRISLVAGNQQSNAPLLRYLRPVPLAVLPLNGASFPTMGQTASNTMILGAYFGFTNYGRLPQMSVTFTRPGEPFVMTCISPVRLNDTAIICQLPEGSGAGLTVSVTAADQTGSAANLLSYDVPRIASARTLTMSQPPAQLLSNSWLLRGPTSGGGIVRIFGSNFGRNDTAHCIFASWINRPLNAPAQLCNRREDYYGEGEIAVADILVWNHTYIEFAMPPGLGMKELEFDIRGSRMGFPRIGSGSEQQVRFLYDDPVLYSLTPSRATTLGGDVVMISARNLGPSIQSQGTVGSVLAPGAYVRVDFSYRCVANSTGGVTEGCLQELLLLDQGSVAIRVPPGVGVGKNVSVTVVDAVDGIYRIEQRSNSLNFSYLPPRVTVISPNLLMTDDGRSGYSIVLTGNDFGDPTMKVQQRWTEDEAILRGWVDGMECPTMSTFKDVRGNTRVNCALNSSVTVGVHGIDLLIAGQMDSEDASSSLSLEIGCVSGFYGHVNETCAPCPVIGADCPGMRTYISNNNDLRYPYPIPQPGFFNVNGTMRNDCPAGQGVPDRDVCIVACANPAACLGDNFCAEGYTSAAPMWRCATCAPRYYMANNECVKCPQSPLALIIGFILLVAGAGAIGYFLNKKGVNLAMVSIGVDLFQTLAIFGNAKIQYPPVLKQLFRIFAAFNLNIEVVAPECLVPNVSFKTKWTVVMMLPVTLGSLFLGVHSVVLAYKYFVLRRSKKELYRHMGGLVSAFLALFYILYLYLVKTVFDVYDCAPLPNKPDGKKYMQAVVEPCGEPGGTQVTLLPGAVICTFGYVIAYPAFVAWTLRSKHELIMEDQLLRAKGTGHDRLTNPRAYYIRRKYGRLYYQFKPDYVWWILCIVMRKFGFAVCALFFNKNSTFQMAAMLLVIFLAYAGQVRFLPYMSPSDCEEVLKDHQEKAFTSAIHARLRAAIADIEARGKKRGRKNLLTFEGKIDRSAVLGILGSYYFNYNTVDTVLLFASWVICLMAIMYSAVSNSNNAQAFDTNGITGVAVLTILTAVLYYLSCVIVEIVILVNQEKAAKAIANNKRRKSDAGRSSRNSMKPLPGETPNVGNVEASMNPMFMSSSGSMDAEKLANSALEAMNSYTDAAPPLELWKIFVRQFNDQNQMMKTAVDELTKIKRDGVATGGGRSADDDIGVEAERPRRRTTTQFAPVKATGASSDGSSSNRSLKSSSAAAAAAGLAPTSNPLVAARGRVGGASARGKFGNAAASKPKAATSDED